MKQVLSVAAVIDLPMPATWVNQLLVRLREHECIALSTYLYINAKAQSTQQLDKPILPTSASTTDLASKMSAARGNKTSKSQIGKLADRILLDRIDLPRFKQDPLLPEALSDIESPRYLGPSDSVVACDVILNLTSSRLPHTVFPDEHTELWDAHVDTLNERIENALLTIAPLIWLHLWKHLPAQSTHTVLANHSESDSAVLDGSVIVDDHSIRTTSCQRIASHALPRQTYSLSDLKRAAYFCLPSLFVSRLNWLARGANIITTECSIATSVSGPTFDPERHAAQILAENLQETNFRPDSRSDTFRLYCVLKLWIHQSIERIQHHFWYEQWELAYAQGVQNSLPPNVKEVQTLDAKHVEPASDRNTPDSYCIQTLTNLKLSQYTAIRQPARTWWADPHLYQYQGAMYVFFEEMPITSSHGHLSVAQLNESGEMVEVKAILDEGQHLSYPYVFDAGDQIYMIPETTSRRCVQLYQAERFPDKWRLLKELLSDVDFADSTIHFDGQLWWMFTNAMSHPSINERDELHLYYSTELTGDWQAHPMNPVVTGVDRARMAGSVFREGNTLYRPSQYGAKRYGYGINLQRINKLDTATYSEQIVARLEPEPGSQWLGCHSISHRNGITIIDRVHRLRR